MQGNTIVAAGPAGQVSLPRGATTIDLPGMTVLPGLIDAHTSHLPTPVQRDLWNVQVLPEPLALRTARAVVHVHNTLWPGSRRCGTWARRAPGNPMSASSKRSSRASSPAPACSS